MKQARQWARIAALVLGIAGASGAVQAEIIEETGSLRGFLAGDEPAAAYDNWVTHVVEGISDPGYNDYGPTWLDPQTTGFGSYRLIPDTPQGDYTVAHWNEIFGRLMAGELDATDALISDSAATFHYETVRFTDTDYGRVFWMLREQLDPSFVDDFGTPGDPDDDVVGSFRNGWGVFIVNPNASRPNVLVQVVHPTDDFFAPIASVEMFLRLDAGALVINGTGREVRWTEVGDYANGKSLSDPSRYPRHPVQMFHEAFVARFDNEYPGQAQVMQLHSFDPSHDLATPNIMSAGYYLRTPTLPLRDLRREGRDIAHMTPHPVFNAGDWVGDSGPLGALPVNTYYALNCDEPYYVYTSPSDSLLVPQATTLRADPNNQQVATFLDHSHYIQGQAIDPFLHVEMDEYPDYLDDGDVPRPDLFNLADGPPVFDTYQPMLDFYEPFFGAVEAWYAWMDDPSSPNPPPAVPGLEVDAGDNATVRVRWPQVRDGHHVTYEIVADNTPPDQDSPVYWDVSDDPSLRMMGFDDWTELNTLPDGFTWYVAARIRDLAGNVGPLSPPLPVIVEDTQGIDVELDEFTTFPVSAWPMWLSCRPVQDDVYSIKAIWRLNGGETDTLALHGLMMNPEAHTARMPEDLPVQPGDLIEWKLLTRDESNTGNEQFIPADGWFECTLTNGASRLDVFDFESTSNALILEGDWEQGVPTSGPMGAVSGENVLATGLDGPYENGSPSHAFIENALRPEYGPLFLTYKQWVDYASVDGQPGFAQDGGRLRSEHATFEESAPLDGYTHRIFQGPGDEAISVFSGTSTEWQTVIVDLFHVYGRVGYLEFSSETDGETGHDGWYIDDIQLVREVNLVPPQPFSLTTPEDGAALEDTEQVFAWEDCVDDDLYTTVQYEMELVAGDSTLRSPRMPNTFYIWNFEDLDLYVNGPPQFSWRVIAFSQGDSLTSSETFTLLNPFSDVDPRDGDLPREFALREVWPNPFNATLNLRFDLPRAAPVKVMLFNVLGQRVAVLDDMPRAAGTHRLAFQAGDLASGVYLMRLSAGDHSALRKVVLVK